MPRKPSRGIDKTTRKAKAGIKKATKGVRSKSREIECQICGRKANNPVDAMTHLLDHGSSAMEGISRLIKDQKEGRVSKTDRDKDG